MQCSEMSTRVRRGRRLSTLYIASQGTAVGESWLFFLSGRFTTRSRNHRKPTAVGVEVVVTVAVVPPPRPLPSGGGVDQ